VKAARFLGALALSALLVVMPSPANAVTFPPIAPGIPNPVNVLPSVVTGAVNAPAGAANIALLLATWSKNPAFWKAAQAASVASATPAQTAIVAAEKVAFKVPAVPTAGLLKVVGPLNVAITGGQIGLMIGNGAVRLLGFKDGMVCQSDGPGGILRSVAAVTSGVDCTAYDMTADAIANANADAVAGTVGTRLCSTVDTSACVTFISTARWAGPNRDIQCWKTEGGSSSTQLRWIDAGGVDRTYSFANLAFYFGLTGATCGAPSNAAADEDSPVVTYQFVNGGVVESGVGEVVTGTADPERFIRCTLRLVGGSVVTALSEGFHESDGAYAPTVCPDLPEGGQLEGWDIDLIGGPDELNLMTQDVTPEYGDWAATYPECAEGTCMLDLQKSGLSCFTAPVPCADWFADPDKEATYQCRYGEHDVALSECTLYAPTFKPDATTTGETYGDPETGQAQPTSIPADQDTFGSTVQDPDSTRQCFPTGWAVLNPVEWVTKPVQCALQWAFVPRASVLQATTDTMTASWDAGIGDKLGQVVAPFAALPVMTGCDGVPVDINIDWPTEWEIHWVFGYACDGPLQPLALAVRTVFSGLFVFMGLKLLSGYLGGAVGFRGFGNGGGE